MSDQTETETQKLDEDILAAIAGAKEQVAPRYAGFGIEPEAFYVEGCGQHIVCLPLTFPQKSAWQRQAKDQPTRAGELLIRQCAWWVRGQEGDGPKAAIKRLEQIANLGGSFAFVFDVLGGELLEAMGLAGGEHGAKKL